MEQNTELTKVMNKLAKLKKLYEGALEINSEGEAQAAAFKIQQLLTQYNLQMEDIKVAEDVRKSDMQHEKMSGYKHKSIGGWWEYNLARVISKHNFCKVYAFGDGYKDLLIVGSKENMETVKWLIGLLEERFIHFSNNRYKEYKASLPEGCKPMSKDKFQRSYLSGCAAGLDAKLTEEEEAERKRQEAEYASKVTALVVRNDAEITDYVTKNWSAPVTGRRHHENFDSARSTGYTDGKNTNLSKGVEGSSRSARYALN